MDTNTQDQALDLDALLEKAEAFGRTTYELSKLKALETSTVVVTALIAKMCAVLVLGLFVLVLSVGVALLLGDVLGKLYLGFFIVAGFYLLVGIVCHLFLHKWIKQPVFQLIVKQALQ